MERIIFLYEKDSKEVFAFMPDLIFSDNYFTCYATHEGHGACSLEYAKECEEAKVSDILPLHYELTQMGYDISTTSKNALFWIG